MDIMLELNEEQIARIANYYFSGSLYVFLSSIILMSSANENREYELIHILQMWRYEVPFRKRMMIFSVDK